MDDPKAAGGASGTSASSGQRRPHRAPKSAVVGMVLRLPDVERFTGLSRSAIYRLLAEGKFPQPVRIGLRTIAFVTAEIEAWLNGKIRARGGREE